MSSGRQPIREQRDIFLSHRSTDDEFVWELAGEIEAGRFQGKQLTTWVDEAEIQAGESIPGKVNEGLEMSRFVALIMTPAYFESPSGWTDAEWHAILHGDPDNRKGRIIPILAADCPYIPYLLRHLAALDFRGSKYGESFEKLLHVLRNQPLPRPVPWRGQLVTPGQRVDRSTLVAERAVPEAEPDVISERLYCNLLPMDVLPAVVYRAPIARVFRQIRIDGTERLPSKQTIKDAIREAQLDQMVDRPFVPAFRTWADRIISFHDLRAIDGPFNTVVEREAVQAIPTGEFIDQEEQRKIVVSLLNMAVSRYAGRVGLVVDDTKNSSRFFFPPKDGKTNVYTWVPRTKRSPRTVAKPFEKDGKVQFWRHLGAYLKVVELAGKFYLQIIPTSVFTKDGKEVETGPGVGRLAIRWQGVERNLNVLFHVRFWATVLRQWNKGGIRIHAGDQVVVISSVPAAIQQSSGIAHDQRDLLGQLDEEAELIAQAEDELAEVQAQFVLEHAGELHVDAEDPLDDMTMDDELEPDGD